MRKHMYLITEHEDEEKVGAIMSTDTPMSRPVKNEEGPMHVLDDEEEDIRQVGKKVGLGYHDYATDNPEEEHIAQVMQDKLTEIDEHWVEKAGLELEELVGA